MSRLCVHCQATANWPDSASPVPVPLCLTCQTRLRGDVRLEGQLTYEAASALAAARAEGDDVLRSVVQHWPLKGSSPTPARPLMPLPIPVASVWPPRDSLTVPPTSAPPSVPTMWPYWVPMSSTTPFAAPVPMMPMGFATQPGPIPTSIPGPIPIPIPTPIPTSIPTPIPGPTPGLAPWLWVPWTPDPSAEPSPTMPLRESLRQRLKDRIRSTPAGDELTGTTTTGAGGKKGTGPCVVCEATCNRKTNMQGIFLCSSCYSRLATCYSKHAKTRTMANIKKFTSEKLVEVIDSCYRKKQLHDGDSCLWRCCTVFPHLLLRLLEALERAEGKGEDHIHK